MSKIIPKLFIIAIFGLFSAIFTLQGMCCTQTYCPKVSLGDPSRFNLTIHNNTNKPVVVYVKYGFLATVVNNPIFTNSSAPLLPKEALIDLDGEPVTINPNKFENIIPETINAQGKKWLAKHVTQITSIHARPYLTECGGLISLLKNYLKTTKIENIKELNTNTFYVSENCDGDLFFQYCRGN